MSDIKNGSAPFFSVIIPVYNREKLIVKSIGSVLGQSFSDFELIVVDDGSSDGTEVAVKKFKDGRLRYVRQSNAGPAAARNRGIRESRGKYLAFLDSDDWWLDGKLKETADAIEENPGCLIFHTEEKWFRGGKVLNQKKKHAKPSGRVFERCLELCCISISTAVVRRDVFDKTGFFDESLPACEDYDFWLRASVFYPVFLIDKVLTEKEGGHKGRLSQNPGLDRYRIESIKNIIDSGVLDKEKKALALEHLTEKCRIYAGGCFKRGKNQEGRVYRGIAGGYNGEKN